MPLLRDNNELGTNRQDLPLEEILALVYRLRGIDFRRYRRATIERRTRNRMLRARADTYADYRECLLSDPQEVDHLIQHLTIKVSRFFRDASLFSLLGSQVLPDLAGRHPGRPLRVWSAGCGNGEESYSLAILMLRVAGLAPDSLVYATDVDEQALAAARAGVYGPEALAEVPPADAAAFFVPTGGACGQPRLRVTDTPRALVEYHYHDLTAATAPPLAAGFDLVCCRNVLIYFEKDLRERVQQLLLDSTLPGGYLCLGESEWPQHSIRGSLEVIDRKARLFRRVADPLEEVSHAHS